MGSFVWGVFGGYPKRLSLVTVLMSPEWSISDVARFFRRLSMERELTCQMWSIPVTLTLGAWR